jgi:hypothetical protein
VYFGKQSEAAITYILACGYQASTTTAPNRRWCKHSRKITIAA